MIIALLETSLGSPGEVGWVGGMTYVTHFTWIKWTKWLQSGTSLASIPVGRREGIVFEALWYRIISSNTHLLRDS